MSTSFVQPRQLEALGSTRLRARSVVEGFLTGLHRSPHRGASVEFAEFKEYQPGDDIRRIDWQAFARTDRYHVRQFEDETNVRAYLVMDVSRSMDFAHEGGVSKRIWASTLLASFAWLLLRQGDAPGLLVYGDHPGLWLPPSSRRTQLEDLCRVLDEAPAQSGTDLERALSRVAESASGRSLVVIASDLLETGEEMLTLARVLRRRGMEVVVFHVMDRAELDFPWEGMTLFEGLEGEGDLLVDPDDLRAAYQAEIGAHLKKVTDTCVRSDIEYFRAVTDHPVEEPLRALLQSRAQRRGRR